MSYNNHDICPFYLFIFYSATYSEHRNKKVPIVSRASASNSRFGDHSYANVQAMYLKSMASEVRTHSTSHVWLAGNEMVWTGFQWTEIKMREAWPQCSLNVLQWLLANGFYIKKFLWPNQRGSTGNFAGGGSTVYYIEGTRIDFVASTMNIPDSSSPRDLEQDFKHPAMFSKSTCQAGQLTSLLTKPNTLMADGNQHSFRQCGFASLLAYFCFLDTDHLPSVRGYPILKDKNNRNPWLNGNMPNLRNAPANFNNDNCKIIYAINQHRDYQGVRHLSAKENQGPQKGSKAILYAAYAAGYMEMVAYKNPPCRTTDPNCPCPSVGSDGSVQMGNAFNVRSLLSGFNRVMDPTLTPGSDDTAELELIHFDRHFGNQWFFCKRI